MVPVELKNKVKGLEDPSKELNATAAQKVKDILAEAEKVADNKDSKTSYWSYTVPFAGVRYYSY